MVRIEDAISLHHKTFFLSKKGSIGVYYFHKWKDLHIIIWGKYTQFLNFSADSLKWR